MEIRQKINESVESAANRAIGNADEDDDTVTLVVNFSIEVWPGEELEDLMLRIIDLVRG